MTLPSAIKSIIKDAGFHICPACEGEGEVGYFCGHETFTNCRMCDGHGVVRSLEKQKHRKTCVICEGRKGPGCCDNRGYQEWESYELFEPAGTEWSGMDVPPQRVQQGRTAAVEMTAAGNEATP